MENTILIIRIVAFAHVIQETEAWLCYAAGFVMCPTLLYLPHLHHPISPFPTDKKSHQLTVKQKRGNPGCSTHDVSLEDFANLADLKPVDSHDLTLTDIPLQDKH